MRALRPNETVWMGSLLIAPDTKAEDKPKGHMTNTLVMSFRVLSMVTALLFPILLFIKFL